VASVEIPTLRWTIDGQLISLWALKGFNVMYRILLVKCKWEFGFIHVS